MIGQKNFGAIRYGVIEKSGFAIGRRFCSLKVDATDSQELAKISCNAFPRNFPTFQLKNCARKWETTASSISFDSVLFLVHQNVGHSVIKKSE